ncbi:MAG TPA: hypothetical protein VLT45_26330 [Kofleriaceae bacterium]|nr:hypothetical protein [Kofleriaceae bacterium]
MRWLVALVVLLGLSRGVRADDSAVALLPLDADAKLELYSQSVASEIARALAAGQIDVVVVGPKMAVPTKARLIVDGTITGKGDQITLTLRIRDARAGTVLATLPATAGSVSDATEQLSGKVLPAVKAQIDALHAEPATPPVPPRVDHRLPRPKAEPTPVLLAVHGVATDPLAGALSSEFQPWAHRAVRPLPNTLVDMLGPANTNGYDIALGFEVLAYTTLPGSIPSARARVRVRVLAKGKVVFDRIVHTDTVVGDKGIASDALAARTAREVLAIVAPHLKRAVPTW